MLNTKIVQEKAKNLEDLFLLYRDNDPGVNNFYLAMSTLLEKARAGVLLEPLSSKEIPGDYFIADRKLVDFPALLNAYADFKLYIWAIENRAVKNAISLVQAMISNKNTGSFRVSASLLNKPENYARSR